MGAGWSYCAYPLLARRYGRRPLGLFIANWAMMTAYFGGLGGLFVLWNGGRGGRYVAPRGLRRTVSVGVARCAGARAGRRIRCWSPADVVAAPQQLRLRRHVGQAAHG